MLKCDKSEVQLSRKVPHGCCWSEPYASCGVFKIQTRIEKSESLISRLVKQVKLSVITILVTQKYKNAPEAMLCPLNAQKWLYVWMVKWLAVGLQLLFGAMRYVCEFNS